MSTDSLRVSTFLPVAPARVYDAWLDSDQHAAFTGGEALIDATVGGQFTAWDGYISGTTLELVPSERILQTWRTDDFHADDADSRLEILFEAESDGTRMTLVHTEIPAGQGKRYETGWHEFYFGPMAEHFGG